MNNKCIYYVEGPYEQQLVVALKENPSKLIPGKIKVYNVVQNLIPKSQLLSIQSGTTIVLAFDTDVEQTINLKKNLERWIRGLTPYFQINILYILPVRQIICLTPGRGFHQVCLCSSLRVCASCR